MSSRWHKQHRMLLHKPYTDKLYSDCNFASLHPTTQMARHVSTAVYINPRGVQALHPSAGQRSQVTPFIPPRLGTASGSSVRPAFPRRPIRPAAAEKAPRVRAAAAPRPTSAAAPHGTERPIPAELTGEDQPKQRAPPQGDDRVDGAPTAQIAACLGNKPRARVCVATSQ